MFFCFLSFSNPSNRTFVSEYFPLSQVSSQQHMTLDGRSWIPFFLIPFSFQRFLSKPCENELQLGRCRGWGRAHHKHTRNSKHPFTISIFSWLQSGSRGYSCFSFAHLSWPSTAVNELWMVDLGFLLFSSPFSCQRFLVKHLLSKSCM